MSSIAHRGRPLRWLRSEAPPQNLLCRHRRACLDTAVRRGFPGFSCVGCPDAEASSLGDVAAEHEGLVRLAAAVLDPAARPVGTIRGQGPRTAATRAGDDLAVIAGDARFALR